jgi:hypothetical protein
MVLINSLSHVPLPAVLHAAHTVCSCLLHDSHNKKKKKNTFPYSVNRLFFVMRKQCVYCEAETEYLNVIHMNSISVVNLNLLFYYYVIVGRDSSVGIATRYGNRFPLEASLSVPVQNGSGAHPGSYINMGTESLSRGYSGRSIALTLQTSCG